MKKQSLLLGSVAFVWAQSVSAETFTSPMAGTGWAYSAGTATATGVVAMKMLMQSSSAVKKGHWYRVAATISGYSGTGSLRFFAGYAMPTAGPGSWVTLASTSEIADNFTTSLGLSTGISPKGVPGDSGEDVGAFRFQCAHAKFGKEDPVATPGSPASHLHEFAGNTAIDRNTNTTTIRTKGTSTCGDGNDPLHPVNRSAYWWPAVIDGKLGALVKENGDEVYYKGPPNPALDYSGGPTYIFPQYMCGEISPTNTCVNVPRGMKYITGYNSSTGNCGPTDTTSGCTDGDGFVFQCHTGVNATPPGAAVGPPYSTMEAARVSGNCVLGGQLRIVVNGPNCWDGVNIDSPNHRDHVKVGRQPTVHFGNAGCPSTHPVAIPTFNSQNWYTINQDFLDGYWHLSSDEMVNGAVAGSTSHLDYFWGWSPTVAATWFDRCVWDHSTCSNADLGNGTHIKLGGGMNYDGTEMGGNGGALTRPDRFVPTRFFGMGPDIKVNGTYSVVIRAADDGVWGLMGLNGLNATVTGVTLTEVKPGG